MAHTNTIEGMRVLYSFCSSEIIKIQVLEIKASGIKVEIEIKSIENKSGRFRISSRKLWVKKRSFIFFSIIIFFL